MPIEITRNNEKRLSPFLQKSEVVKNPSKDMNLSKYIPNMKVSMFLILVLQVILILLVLNPINLLSQLNVVNIVNEASKQASLPPTEVPVVGVIGDNKLLPSVDEIKKQNDFAAQVYKDAQNGDYVLAYSSKMIIFRANEHKVIYEGDTPSATQTKLQQAATDAVVKEAKSKGLIAQDSTEVPGLSIVVDEDKVKASNASFYSTTQKDDIIATFAESKLIIVFRPATKSIVTSGRFSTQVE